MGKLIAISIFLFAQIGQIGSVAAQDLSRDYPTRPIRLVVGFGAGGASDATARIVAQKLGERLGQPVVIENRPGAGGVISAQIVAQARPDGHSLLLVAGNNAISVSLFKSLPYDVVKDFTPISTISFFTFAFVTRNDSKFKSLADLIAQGKAEGKKPSIGTTAIGGGQHLTTEMFKSASGVDALTVPFNSTPAALTALRSGDVDIVVENLPPVFGPVRTGNLTALAVTSKQRFSGLPNVPTVAESGLPGFDADTWNGIVAPANTPEPIVARLSREVNAILQEPDVRQKFFDLGAEPQGSSPAGLAEHLRAEIQKWRAVIENAKIEKQ